MARPSRAVRAARERWARTRRSNVVKERIVSALKRTLCSVHFALLDDNIFKEELDEVCDILVDAPECTEEVVYGFFPLDSDVITQELLKDFSKWLNTGMGEPLWHEGIQWCEFVRRSFLKCSRCRGNVPILLDSDSE